MQKLKKPVSILLSLIMVISLFTIVPVTANAAQGVEYIYRTWDYDNGNGLVEETRTCTDYTDLSGYTANKDHTLTQGWYVAANVTFGKLTITGDVHIIVPDNVTMKCTKGIIVVHQLNIYGQQNDEGTLDVYNSTHDCAAIGGSDLFDTGDINIFGGTVKAESSDDAAGIGSGENHGYTSVNIYGGKVTAIGSSYGAGIGSGASGKFGTVRIYGGEVTATGGERGAGIGGGNHCDGSHVYILGGTVKATGGKWGAGIGGGNKGLGGELDIRGGKVTAQGGFGGAGVGGGDGACRLDITNVWSTALNFESSGGELTAIGGDEAAGIGGGNQEEERTDGSIEISGGTITATGGTNYGAGIGGGDQQKNSSPITITGGKVTATGGVNAAGIGSGDKGSSRGIMISGGEVIANGGTNGAGIGSGNDASCGTVEIKNGTVTARGGDYAAGIGGGNNKVDFSNVTIKGGTVNAWGGKRGAGIGGGEKATGGNITVSGGDSITAAGGIGGAGIGKGSNTNSDTISVSISGGVVDSTGGVGLFDEGESISIPCAPAIGGAYFTGTIRLDGGDITAKGNSDIHYYRDSNPTDEYGYGTVIGSNSSYPRVGTVRISAGAVVNTYVAGFEYVSSYHYYANDINFVDEQDAFSRVQYDSTYAAASDRAKACGWKAKEIHIAPCTHGDYIYSSKNSDVHTVYCLHCSFCEEEQHNDVLTSWTWSNNNKAAAANFTCKDCGHTVSVDANVRWDIYDDEDRYEASVEHNGEAYSAVRTVRDGEIIDDGVVVTWEDFDGTILDTQIVQPGSAPVYSNANPVKPGADSSEYTFAGWAGDNSYYFEGESLPPVYTQTVYTPIYEYTAQTEPHIDASGEYIPGKERHYLIDRECYEINEDTSVGVMRDSVDISDFEFELLSNNTYRINKYTGQTDNLTELVIPKSYKSKAVTVLGDDSRDNKLFTGSSPQFTLVLNENIKTIGAYTFWGVKVAKVTGDTSALNCLNQSAFSYANTADDRSLDIRLDYPGMINCELDAFNGMKVTARVKHATYFDNVTNLHASSIKYVFTDEHNIAPEWQWADDYSTAAVTLACSDTRCSYHETFNATVTEKSTDEEITYTATAEALGDTYTETKRIASFAITTLDSDNGKAETDVQRACEDEQVGVTLTPDKGYHLSSVSVSKNTKVPLTYIMGGNGYENEKGDKLIDGNKSTVWRQNSEGYWTVIMKADRMVSMAGYSLTTGNTVADNPESNWKSWTIYGGDFESDTAIEGAAEGWTPIVEVVNDTVLQAENNRTFDFALSTPAQAYKYYLIRVFDSRGADFIQMSELELKTEGAEVELSGEGDTRSFTMPAYPVIVSAEFEPDLHTVTWLDEDGTQLEKDENVPYGSTPEYSGDVPTKLGSTFVGWNDGANTYAPDALPEVTEDVTYTAVFELSDGIGAVLTGNTISLQGDIGVNFYMELSDSVISHKDTAYMRFSVPKSGSYETKDVLVKDARTEILNGKTNYIFKCNVSAKEMASQIKAQLIDGDKSSREYTYSVKEYADYLLSHTGDSAGYAKAAPLVKAMLNYGANAQVFFDNNTDNLANSGLTAEERELGDVTITEPEIEKALPDGVTLEGATLSLKSETTLSLYFKSSKTLTFSVDGKTVETASKGEYQIARIRGIKARELQSSFTVNATAGGSSGSVTYSPMNYCYNVISDDQQDESLINVNKALILYAQAADEYF